MKILGIDTSSKIFCLGLSDGSRVYEYNLELGRKLSGLLVPTLKRALNSLGWKAEDIDYLACGLGPGSFTGLRVGIATIKGLSWSLKKPVAAIPSLDILAMNARVSCGFVAPAVDAKRNLLYCSLYRVTAAGLRRILPYLLLSPEEFILRLKKSVPRGSNIFILAEARALLGKKILSGMNDLTVLDQDHDYPRAGNIIILAKKEISAKKLIGPDELSPIYLYPGECQVRK